MDYSMERRLCCRSYAASNAGGIVHGVEITDWPDIEQRAIHYDTKHHQDKASYVKNL